MRYIIFKEMSIIWDVILYIFFVLPWLLPIQNRLIWFPVTYGVWFRQQPLGSFHLPGCPYQFFFDNLDLLATKSSPMLFFFVFFPEQRSREREKSFLLQQIIFKLVLGKSSTFLGICAIFDLFLMDFVFETV